MEGAQTRRRPRGVQPRPSRRDPVQIRPPGGDGEDSTPTRMARQMARTTLCRRWPHCRFGDACTFAHGVAELRPRPDLRKTSLCPLWLAGTCLLRSAECNFAHGRGELRATEAFIKPSTRGPRSADVQQPREAACSATGSESPAAHGTPSAPPRLPFWLMPSETWSMQAPRVFGELASRAILPTQRSPVTEQEDAVDDMPSSLVGKAGTSRAAKGIKFDGAEESEAYHEQPACSSDFSRTSVSRQAELGVCADDSRHGATAQITGNPYVAGPILNRLHAGPLRGTAAPGPPGCQSSSVCDSFTSTLELIGIALQLVAERHEPSVMVTMQL